MIGEEGMSHLPATVRAMIKQFKELPHEDAQYYKKIVEYDIQVNESLGQVYVEFILKGKSDTPKEILLDLPPMKKLISWLSVCVDDIKQADWTKVASEMSINLLLCSVDDIMNLRPIGAPDSFFDQLIGCENFNDLYCLD